MDLHTSVAKVLDTHGPTGALDRPGVAVVAVAADDPVPAIAVRGAAVVEHGVALTARTPMYVASLGKLATAIALHRLAEAGRLDLDAPIATWFPTMTEGHRITVRHLLLHRSGLPEYHALRLVAGRDIEDRLTPEDIAGLAATMPILFEPGSRASYNNTNYALAAMVVSRVAETDTAAALRSLVFDPADMRDAHVRGDPSQLVVGAACGYVAGGGEVQSASSAVCSVGDAGMWWSPQDLAGFCRMLMDDGSLAASLRSAPPLPDGTATSLATGATVRDDDWFGGVGEFLGWRSELRISPDRRLAVAVVANDQRAQVGHIVDALVTQLDRAPEPKPLPVPTVGDAPAGWFQSEDLAGWRFDEDSGGVPTSRRISVTGLSFSADLDDASDVWRVRGAGSTTIGWEVADQPGPDVRFLVVREGDRVIARLTPTSAAALVPDAEELERLLGVWACSAARAFLAIEQDPVGGGLAVRRGQRAPEALGLVGLTDGGWLFAAPWGMVLLDGHRQRGALRIHRADGLSLERITDDAG